MLAHDFGNGVALMRLLRLLCMIMLGLLLCAEISLKNRKILLILPEIDSLGGVL